MIDPKKTYKTRDGREVRIYAVDVKDSCGYTVHGAVLFEGDWSAETWQSDGSYDKIRNIDGSTFDLIEVKPRIQREVWVNVYRDNKCGAYASREMADACCAMDRIACVKLVIDCEEGEGL